MKKVTKTTIKSFIKRELNHNNLYLNRKSRFDGMVDCVMPVDSNFEKVAETKDFTENTLGISGAWFVGSSRDYFTPYADDNYIGYEVSNCCGSFVLAMKRFEYA